jgi:L-ascorbate metabolism protein UlaG (beta-lactamase superfamily)
MGKVQADIVTVSRSKPDRAYVEGVAGGPRVVNGPGEYEIADVLIAGVATSVAPKTGPTNTAYVFRLEDLAVCHLGDVHAKLTDNQVEELGSIDVLLLPVGGGGALGSSQAAEVVSQLEPSLVIPMRDGHSGSGDGLEQVTLFCREMGAKDVVPEAKVSVTKSSLPSEVRIVVLEPKRV